MQETTVAPEAESTIPRTAGPQVTGGKIFLFVLGVTAVVCTVGLIRSGATTIPTMTGWALVVSTLLAAVVVKRSDRAYAIFAPPLAYAVVVLVLGQVTMLGSVPTIAREVTFFLAAMATAAPILLLAVAGAFGITWLRFRPKLNATSQIDLAEPPSAERTSEFPA